MKVTFRYSGDFTGITREATFDTVSLAKESPALAKALTDVASQAAQTARAGSAHGADQGMYEFEFYSRGRSTQTVSYSRTDLPDDIRGQLAPLLKASKPIAPK